MAFEILDLDTDFFFFPFIEDPDFTGDSGVTDFLMPLVNVNYLRERVSFRALSFSSIERSTHVSYLALFQGRLWLTVIIHNDIALPEHGPSTGDRVTGFMATFLIHRIPILILFALDKAQVPISYRAGVFVRLLIAICTHDLHG